MLPGLSLALVSAQLMTPVMTRAGIAALLEKVTRADAAEIVLMAATPSDQWDRLRAVARVRAEHRHRLYPDREPLDLLADAYRQVAAEHIVGDP